ncbi:MAG: acyloxyacyl hydrolase [Bacteroidales bacterium]|jgi:hypothetical protein|nr:acyloxyacyl hydrolase [Bacteroidales bacterium]MDD3755433.1 acyloxyacyl hydrolase [Bacteroidales bacterium]
MYNFIENHPAGFSLFYENKYYPIDTFQSPKRYRIEAYYTSLSNNKVLGQAYSLLGDIYFRVYKEKIYFFLGSGVSYLSKHYTEDNYRNFAIGSHFNVHINFGWDFIIYQKSPLLINMQFRWNHFSNGAIKMPNTGLNIPSLHLSIGYFQEKHNKNKKIDTFNLFQPKYHSFGTYSIKQNRTNDVYYSVYTTSFEYYVSHYNAVQWMVGTDFIWDGSLPDYLKTKDFDLDKYNAIPLKISLKGGWDVHIDKMDLIFQVGIYLRNLAFKYQPFYTRFGIRYFFSNNFGAQISLRSHYVKADVIEWGLVWRGK